MLSHTAFRISHAYLGSCFVCVQRAGRTGSGAVIHPDSFADSGVI